MDPRPSPSPSKAPGISYQGTMKTNEMTLEQTAVLFVDAVFTTLTHESNF